MDLFVARLEREQHEADERAQRLRAMVPQLAAELYRRGARSVVLFGSLAREDLLPHAKTDIDLCVYGLSADQALEASFELTRIAQVKVDVVSWDDSSDRVRQWVSEYGKEIERVAA